jgi:hypothetical protein
VINTLKEQPKNRGTAKFEIQDGLSTNYQDQIINVKV